MKIIEWIMGKLGFVPASEHAAVKQSKARAEERARAMENAMLDSRVAMQKALADERALSEKQSVQIERYKRDVMHAQDMALTAEKKLHALRAERNVRWPKPARRLSEKELLGLFDVEMEDEFWTAVHQVLDDAIGEKVDEATQRRLTPDERTHAAGEAEGLRSFQATLLGWQAKARRASRSEEEAGVEE